LRRWPHFHKQRKAANQGGFFVPGSDYLETVALIMVTRTSFVFFFDMPPTLEITTASEGEISKWPFRVLADSRDAR
jgi:hypothetical protein